MFGIARIIVRNKVLVIGAIAVGVFIFSGEKETPKPSSPWSSAPAAPQVASNEGVASSFTDKAMKAADSAAKMAGMEEYSPTALKEQTVGNLDKTQSSLSKVASGD